MSDDNEKTPKCDSSPEALNADGNKCLAIGTGVGVLGTGAAIITGAVCPICYIATPVLLGMGVFQKWKAKREQKKTP